MCQSVISDKLWCHRCINLIVNSCICPHIVCHFTGVTCFYSLLFHRSLKAFFINRISCFFQNFFCQIKWESICVIQFKRIFTGENRLSVCFHLVLHRNKDTESLINCLIKFVFFLCQYFKDKFFFLFQFRISVFWTFNYSRTQFCKEFSINSKKTSMTCRTSYKTAKHITSSLICRHNSIWNHKCSRTDMVCNQTNGNIFVCIYFIFHSCKFTHLIAECFDRIYIKNRIYILNNRSKSLKTHTGINIFLF